MRPSATDCASNEVVIFSCLLDASEHAVSLCMGGMDRPDATRVRFVMGPPGRPDVIAANNPAGRGQSSIFKRTSLGFAGGTGGYAYSIARADQVYILYSISGGHRLEHHGLMVADAAVEHAVTDKECRPDSVVESDDMNLLKHVRAWPAEARIERNGLPPIEP